MSIKHVFQFILILSISCLAFSLDSAENRLDTSGLFYYDRIKGETFKLPLKDLLYNVTIVDGIASVELTQVYVNEFKNTIDTNYKFPISDSAVFDKFSAKINGKFHVGKILEKSQAQNKFNEEVQAGNTAAMSTITAGVDVMEIKLGNILPEEKIDIVFSYIEPLDVYLNSFWRLKIYSTISHRYSSSVTQNNNQVNGISQSKDAMFGWHIYVNILTSEPLKIVEVPSHAKEVIIEKLSNRAKIYFNKGLEVYPNRDFELFFNTQEQFKPKLMLEKHPTIPDSIAGMINFYPKFNQLSNKSFSSSLRDIFTALKELFYSPKDNKDYSLRLIQEKYEEEINQEAAKMTEFVFIVDRSGSMENKMTFLISSLTSLLKLVPKEAYFNIISFGSQFEYMFEESVVVKTKIDEALLKISKMDSDFGGTEIYNPLKSEFSKKSKKGFNKVIFLITDGEVNNTDEVISLVNNNTEKARIFCVGLGEGISPHFIKEVGLKGQGGYDFVSNLNNLEVKTKSMLQRMLSPSLNQFKLLFSNSKLVKKTIPDYEKIPFLVKNEPFKIYFILNEEFTKSNKFLESISASLSFFNSYNQKYYEYVLSFPKPVLGEKLHKLAYKSLLDNNKFTDGEKLSTQQIVDLSIKYQILSEFTSFLVVKVNNQTLRNKDTKEILIPNHEPENATITNKDGTNSSSFIISKSNMTPNAYVSATPNRYTFSNSNSGSNVGHYEKVVQPSTRYYYVVNNNPTGLPGAFVISESDSKSIDNQNKIPEVNKLIHTNNLLNTRQDQNTSNSINTFIRPKTAPVYILLNKVKNQTENQSSAAIDVEVGGFSLQTKLIFILVILLFISICYLTHKEE